MKMVFFWTACLVLATVPVYFIWSTLYTDGFIGRISLCSISLMAWSFILQALFGETVYDMFEQTVGLIVSFAAFLTWHLWRFHRRVEKMKRIATPVKNKRSGPDRRLPAQ